MYVGTRATFLQAKSLTKKNKGCNAPFSRPPRVKASDRKRASKEIKIKRKEMNRKKRNEEE